MTFAIAGFLIGSLVGLRRARRAQGNRLDMLQYAAVHGIIFAIIGLVIAIIVVRAA